MSRFYVPKDAVRGGSITIEGKEAHHIVDVMRMEAGDPVIVFDGTGMEYCGRIKSICAKSVTVAIDATRRIDTADSPHVTLIQSLPKKDKMDYIVEKSTELGVSSIVPVITDRTIPDWDNKKCARQIERWQAIAAGAAKQSGRATIPSILPVVRFADYVKAGSFECALIAILADTTRPIKEVLASARPKTIALAIGPEGDFTAQEASLAIKASFVPVSLGKRVLKSDTAGLMALSVVGYEYDL